ncbi:site-specific integrase [Knoellia aerolata]|uniref:site-specific integrase n=1 Tax=Knoellia aerolata TaxID=442954 RepID=UPI0009FEBB78|nr:site-specific integrase [Knoellia aerolata]
MAQVRDGVVKRGKSWSYVIRVADPETGVSKPKWVSGFATEEAAKAARDEARVAARRGEYVDISRATVKQYLTEWLEAHQLEVKPSTHAGYTFMAETYLIPRIGTARLQALKPATLTRLYRELLEGGGRNGKPLSRRTVDYAFAVVRKALNDAVVVDRLLPSNPVERMKRPKRERREPRSVWDAAQLRAFLASAASHRLGAFYWLAAYTGARRGELLNLLWSDLDLDARTVNLRGSVGVYAGKRVEGTTKGGRARVVSIDAGTVAVMKAHRKRQAEERLIAGGSWSGGDLVFRMGLGGPLFPDTVSQLMPRLIRDHNNAVKEAEQADSTPPPLLPPMRLHDLRHIHATMLLLAGVPVTVVAERLGHVDASITLKVYAHVLKEQSTAAADIFAKAVETGSTDAALDAIEDPEHDDPGAVGGTSC